MKSPFHAHAHGLGQSLPFYTTRKSFEDETCSYSAAAWMVLLFFGMIWLNVVLWGGIGVYEAVRVIVG